MTMPDVHPIVQDMGLSPAQAEAVAFRGGDVLVDAGAGSGKTRALVARYLAHLAEGLPLRSIVAITFTRKAALEMRSRIRQRLRAYLTRPDLAPEERQRWQAAYAQLDAARIGTIHSLCAEIVRSHAAEAGVDPLFEVLEEGAAAALQAQVARDALAWAARQPDFAPLFEALAPEKALHLLRRLLAARLEAQAALHADPATPLREAVETLLQHPAVADLLALEREGRLRRALEAGDKLAPAVAQAVEALHRAQEAAQAQDWPQALTALLEAAWVDLRGGSKKNWDGTVPRDLLQDLRSGVEALGFKKQDLEGWSAAREQWLSQEVRPLFSRWFAWAEGRYQALKAERRALDFDDLEALALQLLEDEGVCQRWQGEVQALLVDEFQDTNGRQRDLLDRLDGGRGIRFLVGDAKQSIYRFRGAEVQVFRAERERVRGRGHVVRLAASYRAHGPLLEALNALLRPVLGEQEDPGRPWHEPFAPLVPVRQAPAQGLTPPFVEFHLALGARGEGAPERAAQAVVARLVDLVEGGQVRLPDGRPLGYGDIAILCRRSAAFAPFEEALDRAGVPFVTVAGRGFYDRPEVRDMLNALAALADPTDDLALVGLLRSPAVGLSDAGLLRLVQTRPQGHPLWAALRGDPPEALVPEDAAAWKRARALIEELHPLLGRLPVGEVLERWLDMTHYRAALRRAGLTRGLRNLTKLVEDAYASGLVAVPEFLEYVQTLRDVGVREGEARSLEQGAVQVMTIHAAKGMEFPVVVLGDVGSRLRPPDGPLWDEVWGLHFPVGATDDQGEETGNPWGYTLLRRRVQDQEEAEALRLLYVAATRAQELLLVSGTVRLNDKGNLLWEGWLEHLVAAWGAGETLAEAVRNAARDAQASEAAEDGAGQTGMTPNGAQEPVEVMVTLDGGHLVRWKVYPEGAVPERRARAAQAAAAPEGLGVALLAPLPQAVTEAEPASPRVRRVTPRGERPWAPAWLVGKLVHLALAQERFPDGEGWAAWAEAVLRDHGLYDAARRRDALRRAERMLRRLRQTPEWQRWAQGERFHEVPYFYLNEEGRLQQGVIDLLYRVDGAWHIVEFKTDRLREEEVEQAVAEHRPQVERYRQALRHLLGEGVSLHTWLCLLDVAGEVRVEAVTE